MTERAKRLASITAVTALATLSLCALLALLGLEAPGVSLARGGARRALAPNGVGLRSTAAASGTITVKKVADPDTGTQAFTFTATYSGTGFTLEHGHSTTSGPLDEGPYAVTETVPAGWTLTGLTCQVLTSTVLTSTVVSSTYTPTLETGSVEIELAAGDAVTCTFTNTKKANIIVEKQTLPDGDSSVFEFTGDIDASLSDGEKTEPKEVDPGTYTVSETVPSGWDLTAISCTDANSGGSGDAAIFNAEAGEVVTCTFTNTKRANIVVEKQTLPDGDSTAFDFNGDIVHTLSDGETASKQVDPGTYTVSETVPSGWDLTAIACTDDNSTGSGNTATFNVEMGEIVTCTFTNTRKTGQLKVLKVLEPDTDPGYFDLEIDGTIERYNASDGDATLKETVGTGDHTVGETAGFDTDLDAYDTIISCVDEAGAEVTATTGASLTVTVNEDDDILCTITNTAKADLTVSKTDAPSTVSARDTLTYTVSVLNRGPAHAQDVVATDVLPEGVTYQTDTASCVEGPLGTLTCQLGDLNADQSILFDIVVSVDPDVGVGAQAGKTLTNSVTVTSTTWDPYPGDNDALETTSVDLSPAIKVQKTGPASAKVRDALAYGFTVSNDHEIGDGSAISDVVLIDDLVDPEYVDGDQDGDGILDATENWFFVASRTVQPGDPEELVNTASVSGLGLEGEVVTDTDTHTTTIAFEPTIAVDKTGPAFASLGETVIYTFTVDNDGSSGDGSPIYSVVVSDTLAGGAARVGGDDGDDVLEVGETWVFTASHTPASAGSVTNVATVAGQDGNGDPVSANDQHTLIVYDAAVEVKKSGPAMRSFGDAVAYTVTITNASLPADAPHLILDSVTDDPLGDLTNAAIGGGCGLLTHQEICTFTYTYTTPASGAFELTNTVEARYHPLGYTEPVTDAASHVLELVQPALQAAKTGPVETRAGDDVAYTVTITNASSENTPPLSLDSITDSLKGDLTVGASVLTSTCTQTLSAGSRCQIVYTFTVQLGYATPLVNTLLVEGHPLGLTNVVTASASHSMGVTTYVHLPIVLRNHPPSWKRGTGLPAGVQVRTLAVCLSDPDVLYAGFGTEGYGVYKSDDAGQTWRQTALRGRDVFDLAIDPNDCGTVYAGAWGDQVMKTENGGADWSSASDGLGDAFVYSVALDPQGSAAHSAAPSAVVYAGAAGHGVYRSFNAGESWHAWGLSELTVPDLAFAPGGQALYAAVWGEGVYRRSRSGTVWGTWGPVNSGIAAQHRQAYAVAVDNVNASTVFAATYNGGLYRTLNGGGAWTRVLPSPARVYAVVADPASTGIVYAGTADGGVYRSTANGDQGTWHTFNLNLGNLVARSLAVGPDSAEYLHVGTANGAWRHPR
jgi:uncharacterized repeat protein (TIGR01451 family)